jgi:multiple sugar transport system permease protein
MLYWRTDLFDHPPATFDELERMASWAMRERGLRYGLALQGARYEGLSTVFLEYLGGFGGQILGGEGEVRLDSQAAVDALTRLQRELDTGVVSREALTWQEEQARFAFQSGQAAFMRNWPYAVSLLEDASQSTVAGRFAVAPMPSQGGSSTAALGGAQLAINAYSAHPEAAFALAAFLTAPQQMLERAREAGQFPARPALYERALDGVLPIPASQALAIIARATPRPPSPAYTELSGILQIELHRALTGQASARGALFAAASRMRALLVELGLAPGGSSPAGSSGGALAIAAGALLALVVLAFALGRRRGRPGSEGGEDAKLGWMLSAPALAAMAAVIVFPLLWTAWESLHLHDLRMPWRGRPFVGLSNFAQLLGSARFREALAHTLFFTVVSVALEMALGLGLALALHRRFRGRGAVRAAVLVPWALPTVVAAILFRFLFDPQAGIAAALLASTGVVDRSFVWFIHAGAAWVPVIAADVWKTTPFVALLLLAGLQAIPESLYEAAAVDGASTFEMLRHITLPMLRPTVAVALLFRSLDALRVFDLVYVLTGGGPGTATEPLALLTFDTLLGNLRFGLGAALSMLVFVLAGLVAAFVVRTLGADLLRRER